MDEKLQKVLARVGFGSRRAIENWISAGRISVNGQRATIGQRITGCELIHIDGHPISLAKKSAKLRVLLYHKPEGEVCTRQDPQGRPTIFDHLPLIRNGRWIAVGRLDFNTSGLIIFTTDGELAHRLMHPARELEREYAIRILGNVSEAVLQNLRNGVELADGPARFEQLIAAGGTGINRWYHGVIKEGRNHEVRRLWESQGMKISRLMRIRFGPITLPRGLARGRWQEADLELIQAILQLVGLNYDQR